MWFFGTWFRMLGFWMDRALAPHAPTDTSYHPKGTHWDADATTSYLSQL